MNIPKIKHQLEEVIVILIAQSKMVTPSTLALRDALDGLRSVNRMLDDHSCEVQSGEGPFGGHDIGGQG
jgi:hypothetical protein